MALSACAHEIRVERQGAASPARLTATLPGPAEQVHARLLAGFEEALAASPRFSGFVVGTSEDPHFPDPAQQLLNAGRNPGLALYADLPPGDKALDLYLYDPLDRYWTSEYVRDGTPVPFRCDFLLHLEPAAEGGTLVEAVEYLPRVWPRDHFLVFGNHGPGRYRDIRVVEPTARDREELLELVRSFLTEPE